MTTNSFQKVGDSEQRLYGPRKILLCGYSQEDRLRFQAMLRDSGLSDIELLVAGDTALKQTVRALFEQPVSRASQKGPALPRAAIMGGITEKELHTILNAYRQTGLPGQFWATLTPTSENWRLGELLSELQKENEALRKRQLAKN